MTAPDASPAQRLAAEVDASIWVAASAGTGKTKVLTDRVLALMLAGSAPSRILCLTFTKAAAAEMANRLNDRLSAWTTIGQGALVQELEGLTGALPDQKQLAHARTLFARVLDAPGGMRIETIHAFCQSLLRRFPIEANVVPHFDVMDERTSGEALAVARESVLSIARQGDDAELSAALAEVTRLVPEHGFDELIRQLALDRARLGRALAEGYDRFSMALRRLLAVPQNTTAESVVAAACSDDACDAAALRVAADALAASDSKRDRERGRTVADWLSNRQRRAAGFDEYLTVFFTREGERRESIVTKAIAEKMRHVAETLLREAERLETVKRQRAAAALCTATSSLVRLAAALLSLYERHKDERALLDYDDLVLRARELLHRPGIAPWVLFKLDGGLDHILVDEAQDTNPEQWEIVQALADEFFSGLGAREAARTVFAVGDAKQSIYSFQRADPTAFLRMREHFAGRVAAARQRWRVVDLDVSFRSVPAVLTAVDAIFARDDAHAGVALDGAAIHHAPFRAGQAGIVEVWPPVEPDEAPEDRAWALPVEQRRTREPPAKLAVAIARTVRHWLEGDERLEARDRRVRAGDVMVLVRRRGPFVVELVRALKQADVAVSGVDRILLTDQLAVQDMMALGHFLLLPEDDLTLAVVLKGPLFGFDDGLLFELAHRREGTLWSELRRRAGDLLEFAGAHRELAALLARADFVPPYELFAEILGARGGRRAALSRLGPEAADPLDEFLSMALAYERAHGPSLQGFLHWLTVGDVEVKRDLDQRGRDEVRILTVHGAKGLQAPIVFLPDTLQVPTQTPRLIWTESGLPLWRAHKGCTASAADTALASALTRRDEEYRRLLYVALTRAEDRLYICGWGTKSRPSEGCWYGLVERGIAAAPGVEAFDFDSTHLAGADGWTGRGWRLQSAQLVVPRSTERGVAAGAASTALPSWVRQPPPPEPAPPRPLAPSRPRLADPAVRSPLVAEDSPGRLRGRLVHRLLQSLPDIDPAQRRAAAERYLMLPVHGLDAAQRAALIEETLAVLDHPEFAPLFGKGSRSEVPVVGLVNGWALSAQIDRLVVTDEAVLIVDYKTLRPPPRLETDIPEAYLEQLAAYRAAIAAIYPDRQVHCALLWTEGPRLMPVSARLLTERAPLIT
ncbi:MAG TPA: double-strand break repair helicase AddA [Stellaceae bacterium]|nr:double-strand break repair helicase AddA [Stellaceae bacterium]